MNRAVSANWLAIGASLIVLAGCGGKARSSDAGPTPAMGQGGSAGSGGAAALAGTAGSEVETESPPLDDIFPWFDSSGNGDFTSGPSDEILHIVASGVPARSTLSTHNLFDLPSQSSDIEFSARASAPMRLLVCASNTIQPYDYFGARDAGQLWPVSPVEVGVEWQDFSIPLSEMMPPDVGDADGIPSFFLAFIVEHPGPVEVWLDEVRFAR